MGTSKKTLLSALLLTWATIWFLIIPVAPIVTAWAVYRLWKAGQKLLLALFLVCTPFVVLPIYNIAKAAIDYRNGEATIGLIGYPSYAADNLEGELRIRYRYEGTLTGIEYFTMYPYDSTLRWLIRTKGFQTGSYSGYLPNADEANSMLNRNSEQVAAASLSSEMLSIDIDGTELRIDLSTQPDQIRYSIVNSPVSVIARYAAQEDCLVIALNKSWVYVIDIEKPELLAQYVKR